ncbi:MAG TPA: hypothetical protein VFZ77_02150 [Acidimicrobiales bacterium]
MTVDLQAAVAFMTGHARLLDRRRLAVRLTGTGREAALAALEAYRNPDGGYGALEPDLRDAGSQPAAALHAFEVLDDVAPSTTPRATALCDWLASATLPGGGLPFALPVADPTATAPLWTGADPESPSLHMTAAVTAAAHRVAAQHPAVARHPWLVASTRWCLETAERQGGPSSTLELRYMLGLLDAVAGAQAQADDLLARWASALPASATLPVEGGLEGEAIRPLGFSPWPGRPLRSHLDPAVVEADLDRLATGQGADGGWSVDFASWSPAAALEWRGHATVEAVTILQAHGRAPRPGVRPADPR